MKKFYVFNRKTQRMEEEKTFGEIFIFFLYEKNFFFFSFLKFLFAKFSFFSKFYAFLQRRKSSRKRIVPFIEKYQVDSSEFEKNITEFNSFNDFFIRKLKKESRPINFDPKIAISPADSRLLVFPDLHAVKDFWIKGQKLCLESLLFYNETLIQRYEKGAMAIFRLAPMDYHRFHFPFDCFAHQSQQTHGLLYSVNPMALRNDINILCKNKRTTTELDSEIFGRVFFIEVGATFVGAIHQTFIPNKVYIKGEEKGFFSFGGSTIILLFEKEKILFEEDLIRMSKNNIESKIKMGEILGRAF